MWRFGILSDTHLGGAGSSLWNHRQLFDQMPEIIACLKRDLAATPYDFLLITGDLAAHHDRDALYAARDLLDSLETPYYPAGGNKDFSLERSRAWFIEAFQRRLPTPDTAYSFSHRGLHFYILDPWRLWEDGTLCPVADSHQQAELWAIPPHEFNRLEADLLQHASEPTFIAVHQPASNIPERLRTPKLKNSGPLVNGMLLLEFLSRYPQVKAIFSGHTHLHYIDKINTIHQITTGALCEYPIEYREAQVYDDRVEIHTRGLSSPSFAARSHLEDGPLTAGQLCDRTLILPL